MAVIDTRLSKFVDWNCPGEELFVPPDVFFFYPFFHEEFFLFLLAWPESLFFGILIFDISPFVFFNAVGL